MRGTRLAGVACGLVSLLALGACSSGANPADVRATSTTFTADDPTASASSANPSASTSPSPGAVTSSDHSFNFVVPPGWNLTSNPKALAYLSSATQAHNVAPTLVVTKSTQSPTPDLTDIVQMAMMQARQNDATVAKSASRTIGGERAEGFSADSQEKGVSVSRMYYAVEHNGVAYTIALTSAKADISSAMTGLNSMLSSWTWSKAGDKNSTASGTTPAQSPTSSSTSSSSTSSSASSSNSSSAHSSSTSAPAKSTASSTAAPTTKK